MSKEPEKESRSLVVPFSFEGWNGEHLTAPAIDFAEKQASRYAEDAEECERHGDKDLAATQREAALWWRGLEHLPAEEGKAIEGDIRLEASEHVTALLARAKQSDDAVLHLCVLAEQVHEGLNALAANGREHAGLMLLNSLHRSVDNFNLLAFHKPEAFSDAASRNAGMPGIISPHTEKTEANARLVAKLQVATKYTLLQERTKKMPRVFSTASNLWATRLLRYIEDARQTIKIFAKPAAMTDSQAFPEWAGEALFLPPFSAKSWPAWATVAWKIVLESTGGQPEARPELQAIGASAGSAKPRKYCGRTGDKARMNRVRARVQKRITDAFRLLANGKE